MHTEEDLKLYKKAFTRIFNKTGNIQESARLASLPKNKKCACGITFSKKPKESYHDWDKRKYHSNKCAGVYKRVDKSISERMVYLYTKEGKNLSEIGRLFSVSHPCVKQILKYKGVQLRKVRRTNDDFKVRDKIRFLSKLQKNGGVVQKAINSWGVNR